LYGGGLVIEKAVTLREATNKITPYQQKPNEGGRKSAIPKPLRIPTRALYLEIAALIEAVKSPPHLLKAKINRCVSGFAIGVSWLVRAVALRISLY
jgi:hypothetical protein